MVQIGQQVPDFEFDVYHRDETRKVKLSEYRGQWVVLLFYPADFTFVCPTELEDAAVLYPEFRKLKAEILSVSTDTVFVHKAWHDTSAAIGKVEYPMVADPTGRLSRAFGVYLEAAGLALRGTFLIDPDGVLQTIEIHNLGIGRSAKEALRKVRAAAFVREHGDQVCPANWEPGQKTLKPGLDLVGKI
ncbi:MAG: redoxin domain-containing protein [Candidatus Latescibacterota bacterium]|jgi:peroxiredoxin (alkyl hydroperoxide reductase subunit C)